MCLEVMDPGVVSVPSGKVVWMNLCRISRCSDTILFQSIPTFHRRMADKSEKTKTQGGWHCSFRGIDPELQKGMPNERFHRVGGPLRANITFWLVLQNFGTRKWAMHADPLPSAVFSFSALLLWKYHDHSCRCISQLCQRFANAGQLISRPFCPWEV